MLSLPSSRKASVMLTDARSVHKGRLRPLLFRLLLHRNRQAAPQHLCQSLIMLPCWLEYHVVQPGQLLKHLSVVWQGPLHHQLCCLIECRQGWLQHLALYQAVDRQHLKHHQQKNEHGRVRYRVSNLLFLSAEILVLSTAVLVRPKELVVTHQCGGATLKYFHVNIFSSYTDRV